MREVLIALGFVAAALVVTLFVAIFFVEAANAIETTTLEDALERPVEVQRLVDKEAGVACYWVTRYPHELDCVELPEQRLRRVKEGVKRVN